MPVNAFRRLFATQSSAKSGTMQTWYARLRSRYPSSDPATLIGSFLVLHEVTAVVPLFLGFWGLKSVGAGHTVADWASQHREQDAALVQRTVGGWIDQGEQQAARIGRRYGLFGYQKESKEERQARKEAGQSTEPVTSSLSGDVACLVGSYLFVKALLPVRILVSMRLAAPVSNFLGSRLGFLRRIGDKQIKKHTTTTKP